MAGLNIEIFTLAVKVSGLLKSRKIFENFNENTKQLEKFYSCGQD
jgi:hypothetical protein